MMTKLEMLTSFGVKVAEYCVDITIDKIREADKNRKNGNQTMEARIYQVTIDALNVFPYNRYKKEEKVYDAAESILKELKRGNGDYVESIRSGLNMLSSEITGDICKDFLELLCYEICKEENRDLAIGHIIRQGEKISMQQQRMERHVQEGFKENCKKIDYAIDGIDFLKENMNSQECKKTESVVPVENRAEEYAEKWNKNVFLNDFNEEDDNAGTEIKLSDIYIEKCLPHFKWGTNTDSSKRLKNFLTKRINEFNNEKMLLILGHPGIGKSTLITWIMANFAEKKNKFLVYQFAADLGNVNWQGNNILNEILNTLDLDYDKLENKILILDGFDEIYISGNRERILNILYQNLKKIFWMKNFILIITCRKNYLNFKKLLIKNYIILQAWDEEQIESFCKIYGIVNKNDISQNTIQKIKENKAVFGVPLILYMILALNIDVEKSSSIVDIYDQIFSLKRGGIYDRCYDVEHRINEPKIKRHIHRISQKIAFWIFENNADEAFIHQKEFEEICKKEMKKSKKKGIDIKSDTLIGNFFKLKHCEGKGTDELCFVHRSIYEYFVVVYFYKSIHKLKSKEAIAGKLGNLLKKGRLSKTILELLKYKFDSMNKYSLPDVTRQIFNIMLKDGMTYHFIKEQKEPLLNVIELERNIFSNMLKVVCLWNPSLGKLDKRIGIYLQCNREEELNLREIQLGVKNVDMEGAYLSGADLSGADLRGVNLVGADLMEAYLCAADLSAADLSGADLMEADLSGVYLSGADLRGVDLIGAVLNVADLFGADLRAADLGRANLEGANLSRADLRGANLIETDLYATNLRETIFDEKQVNELYGKYDLSACRVYISKPEKFISYKEYCRIKQKKEI